MVTVSESLSAKIAPQLEEQFPELNPEQRRVVAHEGGPLLVIAGPGSGKTRCLTLRAMNLLLLEKALPSQIVLCTFTEKAAFEIQDRIANVANKVNYDKDISQMRIGTIHGICSRIITENLHRIPNIANQRPFIGNNYKTLDQLPQCLFIFGHLNEICKADITFFINLWETKWNIAKQLRTYFDKITEELIDVRELRSQYNAFLRNLANAYYAYQQLLITYNCVDFAHLQKIAYSLLKNPKTADHIMSSIHYILVDEYQDTNYIQEQILFMLASKTNNICVVGDEDQSLYRFRGATVQSIRRFYILSHIHKDDIVFLTTNYRSHPTIVGTYNRWMSTVQWGQFRSDKEIRSQPEKECSEYPAALSILGKDLVDEADQFAEFVALLKEQGKITDFNQVALLLHSVKEYRSNAYVEALEKRGIPVFCSRAGTYFSQEEVRLMVGCLGRILNYAGGALGDIVGNYRMNEYLNNAYSLLRQLCETFTVLDTTLHELEAEIAQLIEGQKLHKHLVDYFYHLLAIEPFVTFINNDKRKMQNLVVFSDFLQTFQSHHRYYEISFENHGKLTSDFFNNFLSLLYEDGINQYENPEQPFPEGQVPVITIHQAKGLEFPVVVVGSLDRGIPGLEVIDKQLQRFYRRSKPEVVPSILPEPDQDIPTFDFLRLYYVAFSRAMHLLVLTGNLHRKPSPLFEGMLRGLPQWRDVQSHMSNMPDFTSNKWVIPKPRYSFTSHIRMYETCPRQYQFYREYKFVPSHPAETFFGLLVHQAIEKIHHIVVDGDLTTLTEIRLRELFDQTHYFLSQTNLLQIDADEKEKAFEQVMNYFVNNLSEMQNITKAEERVSVVKNDYVLTGMIDLVLERNGTLEILDLKTSRRPAPDSNYLDTYERQLYIYAHALEQRDGKQPERLLLYWTEEPYKEDALMVFPYDSERAKRVVSGFDDVVDGIKAKQFNVVAVPEAHVCKKCDMRNLCIREGLIEP